MTVPAHERRAKPFVENVSFEIRAGEVFGLAGVDGNGQRELCEALCGLRKSAGRVLLNGEDISVWSAARRFAVGLAHIADDRQREGLILPMSLAENLALKAHHRRGFSRFGWLHLHSWREAAAEAIRVYGIKALGPQVPVGSLSGGNQQKIILARELGTPLPPLEGRVRGKTPLPLGEGRVRVLSPMNSASPLPPAYCPLPSSIAELGAFAPRLIVAMNPARGLDVSAAHFVYEQISRLRSVGAAILLVVADLDELFAWSDRLAVMYAGRLTLTGWPATTRTEIGELMLGSKPLIL